MNILVSGATGFIGNHLIHFLLGLNENIRVTATSKNPEKAKGYSWYNKVTYLPADLNNEISTSDLFEGQDVLIHLAWEGLPNYKDTFHFERNLWTNYLFLKKAINAGVKKIVVTGTCFEYGMVNGELKEEALADPSNSYGMAKDTLRKFIVELRKEVQFDFNWIRLFYMYGEGQNERSFFSQLANALDRGDEIFNMSGGEQLRDYLPIHKVAEYIGIIALQTSYTGIVNCCSGRPTTLRSLAEQFIKESRKSIKLNLGYYPYSDFEPMAFWGCNTLLKQIINSYGIE